MTDHATTTHEAGTGGAYGFVRDGYDRANTRDITTAEVENANVYGRNDETIGSISSLKLGTDGKITDAVIDVEGGMGMGGHSVSVPFGQLSILREANGSDLRIHFDTTEEKLKTMSYYDK